MADERIVPSTPKGEEPKQAPPRRRRNRATVVAVVLMVVLALVIAIGFAVNGLPSKGSLPGTAQEQAATQEAAEGGEASSGEGVSAKDGSSAQNNAATQGGQSAGSSQGSQSQPAAAGSTSSDESDELPEGAIRVHVTVTADAGAAAKLSWYPQANMDVVLTDDQTAYGALVATGFAIGGSRTYVSSIGGLKEKALGGTSGWMYRVNGAQPMKPAGSLQLNDGDDVYWHFVDTW